MYTRFLIGTRNVENCRKCELKAKRDEKMIIDELQKIKVISSTMKNQCMDRKIIIVPRHI
jgi:hypothetical protein